MPRLPTDEITAEMILELLEMNEESMPEHAAFAVTCEMLGLTEEEAYEILAVEEDNPCT